MDPFMHFKKAYTDPSMHSLFSYIVFFSAAKYLAYSSQPMNLQENIDTLECLHQAVTHPSTNIAKHFLIS